MASLLRDWLDEAGLRMDDIRGRLTPDHFSDGRVPSRSTLSDRLAGVALREDFIEAVADICSSSASARMRLLSAVQTTRQTARSAVSAGPAKTTPAEAQLMIVQQRSIEVSDRLLRALERQQQLERERSDANQMVWVLLAMVDKLQRDIAMLARQRDRLHDSSPVEVRLQQVHDRLTRSEQQRAKAETELERAQAERHKADQLAEEAAEQVRLLTAELERLRSDVPGAAEGTEPTPAAPALRETLNIEADDIDLALSKAAQHLDDRADRLDQIASELHLDNPPDNPFTSDDAVDNLSDDPPDDTTQTPEKVVTDIEALVLQDASQEDLKTHLDQVGQVLPVPGVLQAAAMLRSAHLNDQAADLLVYAAARTLPVALPALAATLRSQERDAELYQLLSQLAQDWSASDIIDGVNHLREAQQDSDAYQVLSAAGRVCPNAELLDVLARVNTRDGDWILDAASRNRPPQELTALHRALRHLQSPDALKVATAHSQPQPATPDTLPPLTPSSEGHGTGSNDQGFLRPYALAGGDVRRPRHAFPDDTVVFTTADSEQLSVLLPEQQRLCLLCRGPHDISAISDQLSIPLGVAKILVADLIEGGFLAIHHASDSDNLPTTRSSTAFLRIEEARRSLATMPQAEANPLASTQIGRERPVELIAVAPELTKLVVGLGWGEGSTDHGYDVDASAIALSDARRVITDEHVVFYNNLQSPDNTVIHTGAPITPEDDATILIDLSALLAYGIRTIIFPISLYRTVTDSDMAGWLRSAYIRLVDQSTGKELARYNFAKRVATETAVISGELYHFNGMWKFRAVGQGYESGLRGIAEDFGATVLD
ncbi:TerD family protein [Streptomyces mirabilis]|uniref:TerD family protein n=1 Tax=Streptomyces mirabilis TaxID=68239 RepID=UPI003695D795